MLALLDAWHSHGGSRLDRTDADGIGNITDPGAAIMDAAWTAARERVGLDGARTEADAQLASFVTPFDTPPGGQDTGWYMYMHKDLRTILGEPVKGKFAVRYCGGGNLKLSAEALMWARDQQGGQRARRKAGLEPVRVARERDRRADLVRPGPAPVHDALHEPPDRDPAGAQLRRPRAAGHGALSERGPAEQGGAARRPAGDADDRADRRPATTSVSTTPRRAISSATAAAPSSTNCHHSSQRAGERDRGAEDRADRRRPGAVEERLRARVRRGAARSAPRRAARTRTTARTRPPPRARRRRCRGPRSRRRRRSRPPVRASPDRARPRRGTAPRSSSGRCGRRRAASAARSRSRRRRTAPRP